MSRQKRNKEGSKQTDTSSEVEELSEDDQRETFLIRKIKELEKKNDFLVNKLESLKDGNKSSRTRRMSMAETDSDKRHIFALQADLKTIDSELNKQQKSIVGILNGLSQDFWDILGNHINGRTTEPLHESTIAKLQELGKILRCVNDASAEGLLLSSVEKLPRHYRATDRDIKKAPARKMSLSYTAREALTAREMESTSDQPEQRSAAPTYAKVQHPMLINVKTRSLDRHKFIEVFPSAKPCDAESHLINFFKYDKNKDGFLDLKELIDAAEDVSKSRLNPADVQEVLFEIDRDGSNTLDFYEYLLVARMIERKEGRAAIFKSQLVQEERNDIAEACSIM